MFWRLFCHLIKGIKYSPESCHIYCTRCLVRMNFTEESSWGTCWNSAQSRKPSSFLSNFLKAASTRLSLKCSNIRTITITIIITIKICRASVDICWQLWLAKWWSLPPCWPGRQCCSIEFSNKIPTNFEQKSSKNMMFGKYPKIWCKTWWPYFL